MAKKSGLAGPRCFARTPDAMAVARAACRRLPSARGRGHLYAMRPAAEFV